MSGIRIFNAAVNQYRSSQKNLLAISQARQRLEKENEIFEIKKQKAELDLEEAQLSGRMKKNQARFFESQMDDYFKQQEEISKGKSAMIDQAEDRENSLADKSMGLAKHVVTNDPLVQEQLLSPVISASGGGVVGFKRGKSSSVSIKDIRAEARNMWKDSGEQGSVDDYMEKAEAVFSGGSKTKADDGGANDSAEVLIQGNMKKYGKSRSEVIKAMQKKGLLKN